jgi:hypothetical protein
MESRTWREEFYFSSFLEERIVSVKINELFPISSTKWCSCYWDHDNYPILNSTLTFDIVSAGDHASFRISRQMLPFSCTLQ